MKKLLLSIIFALISFTTTLAVDLNPFAYGLKSQYDPSSMILSVDFSLNAPASYMRLSIYDGETEVWYKEYFASSYLSNKIPKNSYHEDIPVSNLPKEKSLTWRVDVKGFGRANVEKVTQEYYLYHPSSIDIDNNPENENFGTVFCVEALNTIKSKTGSSTGDSGHPFSEYLSHKSGAGLYVFDAAFVHQPSPSSNGYNGGVTFDDLTYQINGGTAYSPRRVRVSDDGRLFVSSQILSGTGSTVLWEVPGIGSKAGSWSKVVKGELTDYTLATEANGFYAAPNVSLDVRGSGSDLELAMLSATQSAWSGTASAFRLSTYQLGERTENPILNKTPIDWFDNLGGTVIVAWDAVQIEYDKDGGIWVCQGRGAVPSNRQQDPSLHHYNKNKQPDLVERRLYRYGAGVRYNHDYTKLIVAGKSSVKTISGVETKSATAQCTGGYATIYAVSKDGNGAPVLKEETVIDMTVIADNLYINDFAWDYADNVYAVSHRNEMVAVWALPYAEDKVVSTPAASNYAFTINCVPGTHYNVTTICDPEEGGSILCSPGGSSRGVGIISVEACSELTLTAVPETGYMFLNWKDGNGNIVSTDEEYTFFVTDDVTLTACFDYATYAGITWHNLFLNGEDIAKESEDYPGSNERLWRLFQNEYNTYQKSIGQGWQYSTHRKNDQWQVLAFFIAGNNKNGTGNVTGTDIWGFLNTFMDDANSKSSFYWLGQYLEACSPKNEIDPISGYNIWGWYLQAFINRKDLFYDMDIAHAYNSIEGVYPAKQFSKYGSPEYWRPWWTKHVCGLKDTMTYAEFMPIRWNWDETCATGNVYGVNTSTSADVVPSEWYQWNTASKADQLLAWRDGADGPIVHQVTRPDMELHASYVDKVLQESDPDPTGEYDAKNNDVLSLLANDNYGSTTHNVTIDRKFAGGMYNTVCFPFDLPISKLPAELSGAEIRVFNGVTETYNESGDPVAVLNFITLQDYWQGKDSYLKEPYLQAGVPYLIMPTADVTTDLTYRELKQALFFDGTKTPYGKSFNGVIFQGVFNPTTLPENAYILVADNRIAKVTDTSDKILGYRGYFVINDMYLRTLADQGNVYFSFKKPVTTSIPVAPEAEQQLKPEVRKVMYDGQIYILRGDEVYTITGNRVK